MTHAQAYVDGVVHSNPLPFIVINVQECQVREAVFPHRYPHIFVQPTQHTGTFLTPTWCDSNSASNLQKSKDVRKIVTVTILYCLSWWCWGSICKSSGDGKSQLYLITTASRSTSLEHKILGTRPSREIAIMLACENCCSIQMMTWSRNGIVIFLRKYASADTASALLRCRCLDAIHGIPTVAPTFSAIVTLCA